MVRNVQARALLDGHFDVCKQGKGAYIIFNNMDKVKGRTGDKMRSTARIADNPQLREVGVVLHVALTICKSLGLVSKMHQTQVEVHPHIQPTYNVG